MSTPIPPTPTACVCGPEATCQYHQEPGAYFELRQRLATAEAGRREAYWKGAEDEMKAHFANGGCKHAVGDAKAVAEAEANAAFLVLVKKESATTESLRAALADAAALREQLEVANKAGLACADLCGRLTADRELATKTMNGALDAQAEAETRMFKMTADLRTAEALALTNGEAADERHAKLVEVADKLQAARERVTRAEALLRSLEWVDMRPLSAFDRCPSCFNNRSLGHVDGCKLAACLRALAPTEPDGASGTKGTS